MKRIGLLSDTHGYLDDRILHYLETCDEIWHAGDIGDIGIIRKLERIKPLKAVYGNIDGNPIRMELTKDLRFYCEEVSVWITHIGGYPKHYPKDIINQLKISPPKLFICGHSHILRIMFDDQLKTLCVNPGAAGVHGFHHVRTMIRFTVDQSNLKDMEVIELGQRNVI
jgi:putative phosphoesterase